ncbi:cardiomyopathy-associated protein 5 [Periophthalmus magnuspinnatus]|uniref:cardiomyopathy-associated protein 5 n=1 Tax=Periophthalmus magnuspinnatus TaxID=409849 RepID=UPI0024367073|nr:cardiomyopathy-associated protein 5 [Periophthalmus magnuspinnatus]
MDEPESLDSEMTELQECSYEALESLSQDDEDEVEELQNSLREVIQDHSVKPKLQCLMVDPSFSMVTVQSEDSGIVWETASSRCSTPWASETSSVSEGGSMEGSGAAGKITIIFDEEKVVRRRTRSGRSSRLSDRFSRPGSSRSASALGVERLEMMEVSQPNVKQDKTETEPDLEEIKSMDQQLFSLISEGYEILNIRVPSKLPTVDEEESTELKDNLSYLDQTPKIKSKNHHQWTPVEGEELQDVQSQNEDSKEASAHPPANSDFKPATEGPVDIDYFEKFTLLDVVAPDEQAAEEQDECVTPVPPPEPEQTSIDTDKNISPPASEESFVFVSDEDIVGEHLDEVFYGEGPPADLVQQSEEDAKGGRMRRQSSVKESGSVLFESEETVLTPIYISSGPPKIIDPILLEEPTAMSFMYSDLYEDAMGERRRSDEEYSEAESVTSEKSYKRCLIDDCEEADSDYLEKFILKDETPNVEVPANIIDDHKGGRMMWSQNEFQMSGCLTRVVAEEDIEETKKGVEIKEISPCEFETASQSALSQIKHENKVSAPDQKEQIVEKSKVSEDNHIEIQKPLRESQKSDEVAPEAEISETPKQESIIEQSTELHLPTDKMEITDELATIDTHAPATDIPQTVIQGDETQVSSIVDALIEDTVLEIPKEIHRDSSLEVSADCEPPVQAHVEVIEKGKTDMQTQVCINLQEEVNLVKKSTSTVEDLGQGGEITTQDDDKMEPLEKPIEGIKQEEVPSEESVAPEIRADVVKEMVNVGELILLVPKGQAVEMDIEISPQPDMSQADQEVDQIDDKLEPIMEIVTQLESELVSKLKEKTAIAKEDVQVFQEPIMETQKYEVEDKAKEDIEASVDETLLSMDQSHEAKEKEVAQTDDNLEPISDIVTQLESEIVSKLKKQNTIAKEDVHLPEEIKEAEFDLEKQEIVSSIPSSILQKEMPSVVQGPLMETQKPEVEDKVKEDIEARVDETPVSMDESHKAEQKTDLKEPICIPAQEIPVTVPETITQVQTAPQLQEKEDTAIITDTKDEDVTTVLTEECLEAEKIDKIVSKMEAVPTIEVDLPPASEEEGQNVALEEQMIASVSTETTKQDWSISPNEAETEELDYEIVNKQEGEESHDIEPEGPKQDLDQHKEIISEELEEEDLECKDGPAEEETLEGDVEEETGLRSTLKRFTPLQDLSGLHAGDVNLETADVEENALELDHQMDITENVQDVCMQEVAADDEKKVSPDVTMEYEIITKQVAADDEKKVSPDVTMEYEIITKQDTMEMAQVEMEDESVEMAKEDEYMEEVLDRTSDTEEVMEVDYETIDAEEERQAQLAAELEGLDWYCLTCGCLLSEQENGPHKGHEVTSVDKAYEEIMEKLSDWISELQGRSENIEDLVSELELAYNSVEDQFHESEAEMQAQNEEMMALVMEQYNSMSVSMEEEKKAKLEQLYDQIVSFQESIDSAKSTLETTAREAETDARSPEDICARLTAALHSAMSLELGPKGLLVFEDYAKGNTSSSQLAQRKGIAVPQRPTLQVQEPGSATSSSVTVYWKVNPEDVIDCFQVYCMEDPQGAISEEYRVTVKESYCVLEELEPDKTYKVWVMAVNYTGCSLPSARLVFKTAPSVPMIDTEKCTVTWDTAILRWSSVQQTSGLSYTLEYCRQYELEGEGLRTISGITNFEHKVLLQPNENYLFYIKAVSEAGSSEQSEAALISTKGTKFHLQKATAHPALELSVDQTTLHYSQDTHDNMPDKASPSILGEQLPMRGHYYWENDVSRCTDYRLGVAYSSAKKDSPLGESQLSWCLQCTPTPLGCSYHLVHNYIHSSLFVIDLPERVGIFLDYQFGRLSFYNAQSGQLLGSFSKRFTQPCHPAVGMDTPGSVEVCMVQEVPEFIKDS